MDVSIIIVNYNTFQLTCSCIDTVIRHTHEIKYEVILVDNGSNECSPDLFSEKFPALKLIRSHVNLGFTGGNNLGVEVAIGDSILLLNSDCLLTENSILKCFTFITGEMNIGVVTCMLKSPDNTVQKQCQRFPSILLTAIELFRIHKLIPQPKRGLLMGNGFFDHLTSIYCDSVWGTFFMFPKKILANFEDGKLPGGIFMYAEDLLWCYKIRKIGYLIYYNADTSLIHYHGASSSNSVLKLKHQNEYNFIIEYYGWMYGKMLVLLRSILYFSHFTKKYASEISRIYFKLFITGKAV